MNRTPTRTVTSPGLDWRYSRVQGPTLEPGLGLGLAGERLVAGSLPMGPGRAQPKMATWAHLPVGSPPAGRSMRGRCNVVWVAVVAWGPRRPNPWTKTLAIGTWNVTSLGGKEPELMCGSSLRGAGPSTTLELPRVSWCGLAYSSPAQPPCVGVHPGEREGRFPAPSGLGIGLLLLFVPTGRTAVQSTWPSWSPWEGYLMVLRLGTPLFYWGTSTLTWATRQ
ncbi:hypothetical protein L3Q82_015611 [Scortum barcoo]|uniref:Uncharacterized protein n=1 Tax=Scortum barcoo TaxID=214431 RepID=A0ACB8VNN3_9TELE|nr:hypothetical protein L3Q82_015611 [Scortum barcoo]